MFLNVILTVRNVTFNKFMFIRCSMKYMTNIIISYNIFKILSLISPSTGTIFWLSIFFTVLKSSVSLLSNIIILFTFVLQTWLANSLPIEPAPPVINIFVLFRYLISLEFIFEGSLLKKSLNSIFLTSLSMILSSIISFLVGRVSIFAEKFLSSK